METNPALSVKSPRYSVGKGLTPVLGNEETPALSTASTLPRSSGCAIRAMIAFLTYTFARVSAAINVTIGDLYPRGRRWRVRCGRRTGSWSTSPATTTSSTDQEFAERLYSDLQAKGVRCWFAPHDVFAISARIPHARSASTFVRDFSRWRDHDSYRTCI